MYANLSRNGNLVKIWQKYLAIDMEKFLIPHSTEKGPVAAMLIYVNRQTEITKLRGNYANEPKQKYVFINYSLPQ